jgi:opacity protein-like surface antigen
MFFSAGSSKSLGLLPLLLLAAPAFALTLTPNSGAISADGLAISPQNGQTSQQVDADRLACESWSKGQTGFDVTQTTGGVPSGEFASRREQFNRAMTACLQARGYTVHVAAPTATAPPPVYVAPRYIAPAPVPVYAAPYVAPPPPTLKYHPFAVSIGGGFSNTVGNTGSNLDDGGLGEFGFSIFPAESLPIGLRVDGSYSAFRARGQFAAANNANFGHQNVYGGDADLQFNLGTHSAHAQMYLFGGAGWYREQTVLHQLSVENGTICGFYFCAPGQFLAVTGTEHTTTPWRDSWNAGMGFEFAVSNTATFFVEGRYRQIGPNNAKEQFVPVQVGFRF